MNKILSILIVVILFVVTIFVGVAKPKLHKQMVVVSSSYSFVEEDIKNDIPQKVISQENIEKEMPTVVKKNNGQKEIKNIPPSTKKTNDVIIQPKINKVKEVQKIEAPIIEEKDVEHEKKESVPQQIIETKQDSLVTEIKELTEEEEIIAWNKWRSDIQNQVMIDTNISAPIGVTFKFSFTVDKFGNMSNIKVWSTTPGYSDMAVASIKPVLLSYQGKPILNFPQGTKRVITNVAGGFIMAETTGYSSPSDYSDYERVKK